MKALGITGAVVMAVGAMCPLVRVTFLGNWNYFQIDPVLGIVFYVIVLLGLFASWRNNTALMHFSGWIALVWVVLTIAAVWFKSHDVFSFFHFKKLINIAAGMVKFRWGWLVIVAGAVPLIISRDNLSSENNKINN
ncbi:hypothetical protein OQY15_09300 [Pedobacter sp. MC2016-15]|uniref:hypothetical protein n=1 Tax=Pedobacter sp. MC2016-15 TaxID=2994473 RepID=UPI0022482B3B|nr:hypothetical protein [Pedobacter sp. MC2016-15]MCX2479284.1 hypothetical protein [Pedobacter sp. MC2016-15]